MELFTVISISEPSSQYMTRLIKLIDGISDSQTDVLHFSQAARAQVSYSQSRGPQSSVETSGELVYHYYDAIRIKTLHHYISILLLSSPLGTEFNNNNNIYSILHCTALHCHPDSRHLMKDDDYSVGIWNLNPGRATRPNFRSCLCFYLSIAVSVYVFCN